MIVGIEQLYLSPVRENLAVPKVATGLLSQLKEHGQLAPVVVRPGVDNKFEILSNAETWLGVQKAGLYSVDVVVRDDVDDSEAYRIINRSTEKDPLTEARWFESQLASSGRGGQYKNITSLAEHSGLTRSYVSHSLRLLTLDDAIKKELRNGSLSVGHAKVLLSIKNRNQRSQLASKAIKRKWSVKTLAGAVADLKSVPSPKKSHYQKSPDLVALENKLTDLVGSRVEINDPDGKLIIDYGRNLDVFEGIVSRLRQRA